MPSPKNAYLHSDQKELLTKYYDTAHEIAKKFCQTHTNADTHETYTDAEVAARLYFKSDGIHNTKKLEDFVLFKINSNYERKLKTMTKEEHANKFAPISDEIKTNVLADLKAGMTNGQVSTKYGISPSSVSRISSRANNSAIKKTTPTRRNVPISTKTKNAIIDDLKNGIPNAAVSRKYNVSTSTVSRFAQQAGIIPPPRTMEEIKNSAKNAKSDELSLTPTIENSIKTVKDQIVEDLRAGVPRYTIKEKYHVSFSYISNIAKEFGITPSSPADRSETKDTENGKTKSTVDAFDADEDTNTSLITPSKPDPKKFMDALMEINDSPAPNSTLFDDVPKTNDLETMFLKTNKPEDSLDDLSAAISTLGLMLNKNIKSVSMTYRLGNKDIKIKIEES